MNKRYAALLDKRAELVKSSQAVMDAADGRDLTDDERATLDANDAALKVVAADLEREERRREWERTVQTPPAVGGPPGIQITGFHDRALDEPWASLGDFLVAVAEAGRPGGHVDPRLYQAAASGMSSAVPSDGGFLVRKEWSDALLADGFAEAQLAPRCRMIPIGEGADGLEAPMLDQTSRATGSRYGGVQVYRRAEADTVTATRPRLDLLEIRLEDLMAIAYATDRSLRDATSLEAFMRTAFAEEFAYKVDNEILRGNGGGECLGILNSLAPTVEVAKETGQVAATIVSENIIKMWSRCWGRSRARAVWFYNQDIEPQLFTTGVQVGVGGSTVFMPAGGISGSPFNTLFGRPMVPIEQASTLGTVGDIVLADLSQYILISKGGVQADQSMHVRFLYGERTFRWMYAINGRPRWKSALTPANGTNTLAPFVSLATRA